MATMGMGCMNVLMTLVSMVMIEKAGRKTLMIIGLGGTCVTTVLLMISLLTVVCIIVQLRETVDLAASMVNKIDF